MGVRFPVLALIAGASCAGSTPSSPPAASSSAPAAAATAADAGAAVSDAPPVSPTPAASAPTAAGAPVRCVYGPLAHFQTSEGPRTEILLTYPIVVTESRLPVSWGARLWIETAAWQKLRAQHGSRSDDAAVEASETYTLTFMRSGGADDDTWLWLNSGARLDPRCQPSR